MIILLSEVAAKAATAKKGSFSELTFMSIKLFNYYNKNNHASYLSRRDNLHQYVRQKKETQSFHN